MSSYQNKVSSLAIIPYAPIDFSPDAQEKRLTSVCIERSFKTQVADLALQKPPRIVIPQVEWKSPQAKIFKGSYLKCAKIIEEVVHRTIDGMDYDGLKPYYNLILQMEKKEKTILEWKIDAHDEHLGSTCIGMALAHLNNIEKAHHGQGIQGAFALEYIPNVGYAHGIVIIECEDGLVFVDNRAARNARLFPVGYNAPFEGKGFSISAGPKGSNPALWIDGPKGRFDYYTNIANGVDIASKEYMAHSITEFIPIAVYDEDGSPRKDIKIKPQEGVVQLFDRKTLKKDKISFQSILDATLNQQNPNTPNPFQKIKDFMGSDFHLSPDVICEEIGKFVVHVKELTYLLQQEKKLD